MSPLNDIDKILDCEMRPTVADDSDASKTGSKQVFVKQYLVKWKGLSYLHCIWYLFVAILSLLLLYLLSILSALVTIYYHMGASFSTFNSALLHRSLVFLYF